MGCNLFGSFGCRHNSNHSHHMDDSRRVLSERDPFDMRHDMHRDMYSDPRREMCGEKHRDMCDKHERHSRCLK